MSASPAGGTPGTTPNGNPRPPIRRKPKPADPLVRRKPQGRADRLARTTQSRPADVAPPGGIAKNNNEVKTTKDVSKAPSSQPRDRARFGGANETQRLDRPEAPKLQANSVSLIDVATGTYESGFSRAQPGNYTDYPVFISKRALMEGLRPHVARFYSRSDIDPSDQKEWTRPVRLHRRDPAAPAPGVKSEQLDEKDMEIEEEKQKHDVMRAQRETQRAAALAEIAPSMANPNAKRGLPAKKKITQVFAKDETEEQRARSKLKYEEALPWHIEDFDNRQTWVGSYEAALSGTYAQFVFQGDKFVVAPLEKWYKFSQKRNFKTEEQLQAEVQQRQMKNKMKWEDRVAQEEKVKQEEELNKKMASTLYDGTLNRRTGGGVGRVPVNKDKEDANELDFEEDNADDEEDPVFEGDNDETKETQKRIKRDQLQANIFDMKDEKSYDKAEQKEKFEQQARRQEGKGTRKTLMRRERNFIYESDSEDHPYSEESDELDSEEERRKDEQTKLEEGEKKKGNQPGSGASTKGTNTPSGRKKLEAQRNASSTSLKRSGSPNLSEDTGNESTRKKQKKKHGTSSTLGSGINTPNGPPSRPRSPAVNSDTGASRSAATGVLKKPTAARGNDLKRPRGGGAGSGSEGDGAGSGGEMSDASRKRIKLKTSVPGSKNVSPGGSRATSPSRDANATVPAAAKSAKTNGAAPKLPTVDELKQAVPEAGIPLGTFLKDYKAYVNNSDTKDPFMKVVKAHFKLFSDNGVKMLKPLGK